MKKLQKSYDDLLRENEELRDQVIELQKANDDLQADICDIESDLRNVLDSLGEVHERFD